MKLSSTGHALSWICGISLVLLLPDLPEALTALRGSDFEALLLGTSTLLVLAISAWVMAAIGLNLLAGHAGPALGWFAAVATPRFLRQAMFIGAAGALAVGPVAAMSDSGVAPPGRSSSLLSQSLDGLRLPDRPLSAPQTAAPVVESDPADTVRTVRSGDSLWTIAASNLGPEATDDEIAGDARDWHEANRPLIGADPNLIFPGQQLTPPSKESR